MDLSETISHKGVVVEVNSQIATLFIQSNEECHSCSISEFCGQTDRERNTFHVPQNDLQKGDMVRLRIQPTIGTRAVFIAYIVPFLIILTLLIIGTFLGWKEWFSGTLSLLALVPYFFLVNLTKGKFKKSLELEIEKI